MDLNYRWGYLLLTLLLVMPLLHALDYMPVQLWDESRLAVNALEMYRSGKLIVTTYGGQPDMWNTKPPLLIWMEAGCFRLFGVSELSLRIPTAIACFFTCYLLYWLLGKKYNKPEWGIFSCLVMVTSIGYVCKHRSRTGDYDAMLVLFATAYALFYFLYLETSSRKYLYAFFITLILAALTKGVAAVLVFPALLLYTIFSRKLLPVLKDRHTYAGIGLFLFFVGGYYLLREHYNPGLIKQVAVNELGGRYLHVVDNCAPPGRLYYYNRLTGVEFQFWLWCMLAGIASIPFLKNHAERRLLIYVLALAVCHFLVINISATKYEWYMMPCYPFFGIITGVIIYTVFSAVKDSRMLQGAGSKFVPYILAIVWFIPAYSAIVKENHSPWMMSGGFDEVNTTMYLQDVLHGRRPAADYKILHGDYRADIQWYIDALKLKGRTLAVVPDYWSFQPGDKALVFVDYEKDFLENIYDVTVLDEYRNVKVYLVHGKK